MIDDVVAGIRARVVAGAQLRDEYFPGWEKTINIEILDLINCYTCILGQVGQEMIEGLRGSGYDRIQTDLDIDPREYGFSLGREFLDRNDDLYAETRNAGWSFLGETWIDLIKTRFDTGTLSDGGI